MLGWIAGHFGYRGDLLDNMALVYVVFLLVALVKIADWLSPYHNLTEAGCTLDYVYDGDTIAIACGEVRETARLVGFDTPETKSPSCAEEAEHGRLATRRLREISQSGDVSFSGSSRDKYGRLLVTMRVDGIDVRDPLIAEGLAVRYDGGSRINWCERL